MRILLDECVPRTLKRDLPGHAVQTVQEMGWSGKKNGELLALLQAAGFEVFLTVDQNLPQQQNLVGASFAVVVLDAPSNRRKDLQPLMASVLSALAAIQSGDVVVIRPPSP